MLPLWGYFVECYPLKYVDPSGHDGCIKDGSDSCKEKLEQFGKDLRNSDEYEDGYEKAEAFLEYGASLYGDNTEAFMASVTELVFGYNPNDQSSALFYSQLQHEIAAHIPAFNTLVTPRSGNWLGSGAFDSGYNNGVNCKEGKQCDQGWNSAYVDQSGNQMYHFWFSVAVSYYDGSTAGYLGAVAHDWGGSPVGQFFGAQPKPDAGITEQDYNLSVAGVELGSYIKSDMTAGLGGISGPLKTPSQIIKWMDVNVAASKN